MAKVIGMGRRMAAGSGDAERGVSGEGELGALRLTRKRWSRHRSAGGVARCFRGGYLTTISLSHGVAFA